MRVEVGVVLDREREREGELVLGSCVQRRKTPEREVGKEGTSRGGKSVRI